MASFAQGLGAVESALTKIFGIVQSTDRVLDGMAEKTKKVVDGLSSMSQSVQTGANASGSRGASGGSMMPNSLGNVPPIPESAARSGGSSGDGGGGGGRGGGGGAAATFAASPQGRGAAVAAGVASAAWNLTPGVEDTMAVMGNLFPTAFYDTSGDYDRMATARRIRADIGIGASGVMDPAMASMLYSQQGFSYSGDNRNMTNMLKTASFNYQMTGMSNMASAQGMASLYSGGSDVSSKLMQYGISTVDAQGNQRDIGEIIDQIYNLQVTQGMTEDEFNNSLSMGYIGQSLRHFFGDDPALFATAQSAMRVKFMSGGEKLRMSDGSFEQAANDLGMVDSPFRTAGRKQSAEFGMLVEATEGEKLGADTTSELTSALVNLTTEIIKIGVVFTDIPFFLKGLLQSGLGILSGVIPGFSRGGDIIGKGSSTHDSIGAVLSPGEYVINARAAKMIGKDQLDNMNSLGHEFGDGFASPAPVFLSRGGEVTLSGNPALKPGSGQLTTVPVAGGRRITVASEAASTFQRLLSMWQADPDLGGGRLDLSTGLLGSFNYRQARYSSGISDHAGWAVDVRYDVLKADGKRHMTEKETSAVRRILSALGGKIGWGGDYRSVIDEMHFFFKGSGSGGYSGGGGGESESSGHDDKDLDDLLSASGLSKLSRLLNSGVAVGVQGLRANPFTMLQAFSLKGLSGAGGSMLSVAGSVPMMASSAYSALTGGQSYADVASSGVNNILGSAVGLAKNVGGAVLDGLKKLFGIDSDDASNSGSGGSYKAAPGALGNDRLLNLLQAAGFQGQRLREAWAIVMRESNGRPGAHNPDRSTGDNSYGLFQINMLGNLGPERLKKFARFGVDEYEDLFDPWKNIQAAAYMSQKGKNWSSWVSPQYGRASTFYEQFPRVAREAGLPGYSVGNEYVSQDHVAKLHQGEMVMPAAQAQMFREALQDVLSGARGGPREVNITLNIERASDEEAERFAHKVISIMNDREQIGRVATL